MGKTTETDTVVLADDELQDVLCLTDYLDADGLYCQFASNVNEAIEVIDQEISRWRASDIAAYSESRPSEAPL